MGGFATVIALCLFIPMLVSGEFGQSFFEVRAPSHISTVRTRMLLGLSASTFWALESHYIGLGDLNR